ncbi:MAG: VanZ family protein [Gammaproteobacteria bacterium]|nr:VanZ family protein [Gammaproteobacteria bacterium]MBT8111021.1 VanZ family protein [Gammaproteobacteria bacterium]NND48457.1 VanZ family protein [Woeseiaceae bacterium]NNL45719.1 VanZ family protein [Woeseiaceae bacterium]
MLPLRHARFWRVADLVLLVLVFLSALMPAVWFWDDRVKILSWFDNSDKFLHAATFFVLAVWFAGQYRRPSYWRIAAGLMLFGCIIELCQLLVSYRMADWADVAANTVGIIIGFTVAIAGVGGWSLRIEEWYLARQTGSGID